MCDSRWNEWNVDHIGEHDVSSQEAEYVVNHRRAPSPELIGDGKRLVLGQTPSGRMIRVIYIFSPVDVVFVIHSRDLTETEKRHYRRRSQ